MLIDKPQSFRNSLRLSFFSTHDTSTQPESTPMVGVTTDYISVGGNRHPGAADWDVQTGVLAFGADNNVALWDPLVSSAR